MKFEMFEFMLREFGYDIGMDFNPFTSYMHEGAPKPLNRLDRPFAPGYSTHPELSRSPMAAVNAWYYTNQSAVLGAGSLLVPAYFMAAATHDFPHVAGPQYQSAASGQPGIGSAGHNLIYNPGSLERSNQRLWREFKDSMLNPWNW